MEKNPSPWFIQKYVKIYELLNELTYSFVDRLLIGGWGSGDVIYSYYSLVRDAKTNPR